MSVEWDEATLFQLVRDNISESLTLDYKESAALQHTDGKKELAKDVSAFANSAGGLLIYGVREVNHVPDSLDGGSDPASISKEWLEQVVNSQIQPRVDDIRIFPIALSGERAGRVAYVLNIPASHRAPHMSSDHRYYKRFNFQSVPMEDYEVRDISRRFVAPDLHLGAVVVAEHLSAADAMRPRLQVYVENRSPAAADYALISLYVPKLNMLIIGGMDQTGENQIIIDAGRVDVTSHKLEWRGALRLPLMEGTRYHVADCSVALKDHQNSTAQLFWEVLSPGSSAQRGSLLIKRRGDDVSSEAGYGEWAFRTLPVWRI